MRKTLLEKKSLVESFLDEGVCQTISRKDDIHIWAYNNGLAENIHHFKSSKPTQDSQECKPLRAGPKIAKTVEEFRSRALKYYNDHKNLTRFPPSHYLKDNIVKRLAERLEKHNGFQNLDIKILTSYYPVDHLKIMGVNMKQCYGEIVTSKCDSFENVVVTVILGDRQVLVSVVVEQTDDHSIKEGVAQLNDILKTIYHVSSNPVKSGFISIAGLLVCPNVESNQFNAIPCFSKKFLKSDLFFLKDDWDNNDSFDRKLDKTLHQMSQEMKQIRPKNSNPLKTH